MRVYLDTRDWWVGYYRGTDHHYICPLPCVVIRIRRRQTDAAHRQVRGARGRQSTDARQLITLEELDAHAAITETDWADASDGFSTQSYLSHLQASLPASHQLAITEIAGLGRPALAVAGADGRSWTVCVPGLGSAPCADLAGATGIAADLLLRRRSRAASTCLLRRPHDPDAAEEETTQ